MTQENKTLLLQDLCGRLPYNVKVRVWRRDTNDESKIIAHAEILDFIMMSIMFKDSIEEYKPYLFPLSSMNKQQQKELYNIIYDNVDCNLIFPIQEVIILGEKAINWLNKHHFDYRDLINKKLALDATGLNIY